MKNVMRVAVTLGLAAYAAEIPASMTKDEYRAARKHIAAEAQSEREKCGSRYANAADICVARARGALKVMRSELEAEYKPSSKNYYAAAMARAQATEAIALEECDDQPNALRKGCVRAAKAETVRATAEATARR